MEQNFQFRLSPSTCSDRKTHTRFVSPKDQVQRIESTPSGGNISRERGIDAIRNAAPVPALPVSTPALTVQAPVTPPNRHFLLARRNMAVAPTAPNSQAVTTVTVSGGSASAPVTPNKGTSTVIRSSTPSQLQQGVSTTLQHRQVTLTSHATNILAVQAVPVSTGSGMGTIHLGNNLPFQLVSIRRDGVQSVVRATGLNQQFTSTQVARLLQSKQFQIVQLPASS